MIESIEHGNKCVTVRLKGVITSQEIMEVNLELINHPDFSSLIYQLWIFHDVEEFLMSGIEVEEIASQDMDTVRINPDLKLAIVTDSSVVFGFGRMYEAFMSQTTWETMIFYKLDEAKKWLNIE